MKGNDRKRPRQAIGLTTTSPRDSREAIERRAYEIYLARGGGEGRDVEDWLRAEAEVLARMAIK